MNFVLFIDLRGDTPKLLVWYERKIPLDLKNAINVQNYYEKVYELHVVTCIHTRIHVVDSGTREVQGVGSEVKSFSSQKTKPEPFYETWRSGKATECCFVICP